VFENIGKIASVIDMAVIHACRCLL
jgi:hypothetical protein